MRSPAPILVLVLVACTTPDFVDPATIECASEGVVVTFETRDGVDLVGDYLPATSANRGAIVLFHMAPADHDRSDWPTDIRAAFGDRDLNVLNVDRRGAGESAGNATDATQGIMARLDVEAAADFLTDAARVCPVDSRHVILVGASNGTTSVMDYTAGHEPELPHPSALIWLSPGTYTEANHRVNDQRVVLDALPMLWLYPTDEPYSDQWTATAPDDWEFHRDGAEHGTDMFDGGDLEAATVERMDDFMRRYGD